MNYCLIGKDKFRIRMRVKAITSGLTAKLANLQQVYITSEINLTDLAEHLNTQSLWGEQKLVITEGLLSSKNQNIVSFVQNWLQQIDLPTKLILIEENDPIKKVSQILIDNSNIEIEHYPLLASAELRQWLQQYLKTNNINLETPTIAWLLNNFGGDLWRLSNELTKLKWLFAGQTISLNMAKEVVIPVVSDNVFATIDALAQRNLVLANRLINTQLTAGTSEAELITLIAYQFRNITLIKMLSAQKLSQTEIAKQVGIHPYVVKKSVQFMRDFSWPQLQRIMMLIQKIDQATKRSQTPPKIGLDILMAQVIRS